MRRTCRSPDLPHPAFAVGDIAALDADELGLECGGDRAAVAVADQDVTARALDLADCRDNRGGAAGESLAQLAARGVGAPLLDAVALFAHRAAFFAGKRDDRIPRDAGKNRAAQRRRDERAVVEHEE